MGMDLYSVQGSESFHFNWHGWGKLIDFLVDLECDTSGFSGSNDGDKVPASHCKAITKKIKTEYESGNLIEAVGLHSDDGFSGFYEHAMEIVYTGTPKACPSYAWIMNYKKGTITPPENPWPESFKDFKNAMTVCRQMPQKDIPLEITKYKPDTLSFSVLEDRLQDKNPLKRLKKLMHTATFESTWLAEPDKTPEQILQDQVKIHIYLDRFNDKDKWSRLRYYLEFADFLEACSHLRGFKQC